MPVLFWKPTPGQINLVKNAKGIFHYWKNKKNATSVQLYGPWPPKVLAAGRIDDGVHGGVDPAEPVDDGQDQVGVDDAAGAEAEDDVGDEEGEPADDKDAHDGPCAEHWVGQCVRPLGRSYFCCDLLHGRRWFNREGGRGSKVLCSVSLCDIFYDNAQTKPKPHYTTCFATSLHWMGMQHFGLSPRSTRGRLRSTCVVLNSSLQVLKDATVQFKQLPFQSLFKTSLHKKQHCTSFNPLVPDAHYSERREQHSLFIKQTIRR